MSLSIVFIFSARNFHSRVYGTKNTGTRKWSRFSAEIHIKHYGCFSVSVDLRLGYCKRTYIVTMEMHMMAMLMPFNNADVMTLNDLREITQLPDKDLMKQLQMLVDSRILHSKVCLC